MIKLVRPAPDPLIAYLKNQVEQQEERLERLWDKELEKISESDRRWEKAERNRETAVKEAVEAERERGERALARAVAAERRWGENALRVERERGDRGIALDRERADCACGLEHNRWAATVTRESMWDHDIVIRTID